MTALTLAPLLTLPAPRQVTPTPSRNFLKPPSRPGVLGRVLPAGGKRTTSTSDLPTRATYPTTPTSEVSEVSEGEALGQADLAWIARVQSGDEIAAQTLVQRLYPTIIKSVRYRLPRRTSEEDLVQAIYARIFAHLGQFSGHVPLEHWVSRIAVNTCLNFLKHERVRPELRMSDLREEEEIVVRHLLHTADDLSSTQSGGCRELLDRMLARLRPDERLVITMLHLEERTIREISDLTGWSATLVKVKAFRTRQKLRRLWRALAREEME